MVATSSKKLPCGMLLYVDLVPIKKEVPQNETRDFTNKVFNPSKVIILILFFSIGETFRL